MDNFAYANRTMSMLLGCEQVRRCCPDATRVPADLLTDPCFRHSYLYASQAGAVGDLLTAQVVVSLTAGLGAVGSAAGPASQ
jgi:hypothetical protein